MDHITSAPATQPVTQVDYTAVTVVVDERKDATVHIICTVNIDDDMKINLAPFFLQVKNKSHDEVHFLHLFLSSVCQKQQLKRN